MSLTSETVLHVAQLARLELGDGDISTFARQMADILDYVDQLNRLDTTGIEPTFHVLPITNVFRDDTPASHLEREQALANAPDRDEGCFLVPIVVG
uniref:Aspartyl/glutamyl-tRNA(Asn/Gln) amidotransferase subunit C n=1 Tax=Desulfatirhabdium butyrativorans TaxID=340467 RepID=A0A7C4RPF9_9BACT